MNYENYTLEELINQSIADDVKLAIEIIKRFEEQLEDHASETLVTYRDEYNEGYSEGIRDCIERLETM